MGFFKPADDADATDEDTGSGDEGAPGTGDETGTVGFAQDEGGDALDVVAPDEDAPSEL